MNNWLKLIGSSDKPITDPPFYGMWKKDYVGFRRPGMPGVRNGDHLFLYAPGGSRSIFALAEAIADPEHDTNYNPNEAGSCRWKIRIRYLVNLPVSYGVSIDVSLSTRNLAYSVRQQSYIKLLPEEYQNIYIRLREKAAANKAL